MECIPDVMYTEGGDERVPGQVMPYYLDLYLPAANTSPDRMSMDKGESWVNTKTDDWRDNEDNPIESQPSISSDLPPVVLFVHGGAWQRGNKQIWRSCLSNLETNPPLAFFYWCRGFFGIVGQTLARRGVACAIMSYPIVAVPMPLGLLVTATAAVTTIAVFALLTLAMCTMFLATDQISKVIMQTEIGPVPTQWITPSMPWAIWTVQSSQLVTWIIMCVFRSGYRDLSVTMMSVTWTLLLGVYLTPGITQVYCCLLTVGLVQGVIVWLRLRSASPISVQHQIEAVALGLKYVVSRGRIRKEYSSTQVFLMGHSSGAHLIAIVTLNPARYLTSRDSIKGVICISGVYDVAFLDNKCLPRHFILHPAFGKVSDSWKQYSPLGLLQQLGCVNGSDQLCSSCAGRSSDHNGTSSTFCEPADMDISSNPVTNTYSFPDQSLHSISPARHYAEQSQLMKASIECARCGDILPCATSIGHGTHPFLPAFLVLTSGQEIGPLQEQAAEFEHELRRIGVPVLVKSYPSLNHFSIINKFGKRQSSSEEIPEDKCLQFIKRFT